MSKIFERVVGEWAKEWKKEHLSDNERKLISSANFDLYYGPIGDGSYGSEDITDPDSDHFGYPGFTSACKLISAALDREDCPRTLYIDLDSEMWQTTEPEPNRCETCNGTGIVVSEDNEGEKYDARCPDCRGTGAEEIFGDWYKLEYREVLSHLVGRELVEYIR